MRHLGAASYLMLFWVAGRRAEDLSNNLLATGFGHTDEIADLAWSPDGTKIASVAQDRTVRLWAGTDLSSLSSASLSEELRSVEWSSHPDIFFTGDGHGIRMWNCSQNQLLQSGVNALTHSPDALELSPDGSQLLSTSGDGYFRIYDADDLRILGIGDANAGSGLGGIRVATQAGAWSPDGLQVVTASADPDNRLRRWNVSSTDWPLEIGVARCGGCDPQNLAWLTLPLSPEDKITALYSTDVLLWSNLSVVPSPSASGLTISGFTPRRGLAWSDRYIAAVDWDAKVHAWERVGFPSDQRDTFVHYQPDASLGTGVGDAIAVSPMGSHIVSAARSCTNERSVNCNNPEITLKLWYVIPPPATSPPPNPPPPSPPPPSPPPSPPPLTCGPGTSENFETNMCQITCDNNSGRRMAERTQPSKEAHVLSMRLLPPNQMHSSMSDSLRAHAEALIKLTRDYVAEHPEAAALVDDGLGMDPSEQDFGQPAPA